MIQCLELLAEIVAVIPVPVGTFKFSVPPQVVQQRIMVNDITLPATASIPEGVSSSKALLHAIRQQPGLVVDTYIYKTQPDGTPSPSGTVIIEFGTTVKESNSRSVAGTSYTTKVSMRSYDEIDNLRALVDRVQEYPAFDLFLIDDDDNIYCCRGMEPATQISMQASLPVDTTTQVDIDIISPCGILPVRI